MLISLQILAKIFVSNIIIDLSYNLSKYTQSEVFQNCLKWVVYINTLFSPCSLLVGNKCNSLHSCCYSKVLYCWDLGKKYMNCKDTIIINSSWIKKLFKSVTYLYHVSVICINRQKYFQPNQCHLANLSKNYCVLSTSSRKATIFKCLFRYHVLKVR